MREDEQRQLIQNAIDHRLSGLEEDPFLAQRIMTAEKGDQPTVKKKLSVSFALVVVLMLLTLSAAFALTQSPILDRLFGKEEQVPEDVIQQLVTPQETAASPMGKLSVDELLYDGRSLHIAWTVSNPTEERLLYTMNGFTLNGERLQMNHNSLFAEGAGSAGYMLGGEVDGVALPSSTTSYFEGTGFWVQNKDNRWGFLPLPNGKATLKVALAVWRPINEPELNDYKAYEGVDVNPDTANVHSLQVTKDGYCDLGIFRPRKYWSKEGTADAYSSAYKELGWAEVVDTIELEMEVDLTMDRLETVLPVETEFSLGDCTMKISQFALSHAGGKCEVWIYGSKDALKEWKKTGLFLVDENSKLLLNTGCSWDDQTTEDGIHYTMNLLPISGDLPETIYICPQVDDSEPVNDGTYFSYGADAPDGRLLDLDSAVRVELQKSK